MPELFMCLWRPPLPAGLHFDLRVPPFFQVCLPHVSEPLSLPDDMFPIHASVKPFFLLTAPG